jgi:FkbM family methyltransferase
MKDLFTYLKGVTKPIVMYGMGNGADKILALCEKHSIEICDFFASDGFVRGHLFHGKRVLSYSEIKKKYRDGYIVLMSFATSREEVLENVIRISSECELYLPDVPVSGEDIFDLEYAKEHKNELLLARELFADDESKRIFDNVIKYKISGYISYLFDAESLNSECMEIIHAKDIRVYADFGAYNGDSIRELMNFSPSLERVYAAEPDPRSFRKLSEWAKGEQTAEIVTVNAGVMSYDGEEYFDNSGNRNAHFEKEGMSKRFALTKILSPDTILKDEPRVDYMKYDVEGSEKEALLGSIRTIERCTPALLVSVYHRSEDIFSLPILVHSLCKDYKLYLRRFRGIPAWDINLYAVKK